MRPRTFLVVLSGLLVAALALSCSDDSSTNQPGGGQGGEAGTGGSTGGSGLGGAGGASGQGGSQAGSGGAQAGAGGASGQAGSSGQPGTGGSAAGGSAGTGGASAGSGGTSTGGTGASAGSGGGGTSPTCKELDACCEQLGSQMYSACKTVVQQNYEATCQSVLDSYHQNGYCTGSTSCADLAKCCPQLPPGQGWKDTCDYYVGVNNAQQCDYLLSTYKQDGYCN
ncbi:MAG: hypothetical protein HY898_11920 [Deltaproteobacteria bacterium]|nr:hypothetical protein [Deltaproteobacteria bacterium]